jgi:hypothetical protein
LKGVFTSSFFDLLKKPVFQNTVEELQFGVDAK